MRKLVTTLIAFTALAASAVTWPIVDVYDLKMSVKVPRIYNNNTSLGYRKYQSQRITGELRLIYNDQFSRPTIIVTNLVNNTHKMSNGANVRYSVTVDEGTYVFPRINLIGNNRTDVFKTASVCFYIDAEPSYNKGDDDEDNSLLVTMAGTGKTSTSKVKGARIISTMTGNLAGTLGCGCRAYGHTSPTRLAGPFGYLTYYPFWWPDYLKGYWDDKWNSWILCNGLVNTSSLDPVVDDVAAVWGTWAAKYNKNKSRR